MPAGRFPTATLEPNQTWPTVHTLAKNARGLAARAGRCCSALSLLQAYMRTAQPLHGAKEGAATQLLLWQSAWSEPTKRGEQGCCYDGRDAGGIYTPRRAVACRYPARTVTIIHPCLGGHARTKIDRFRDAKTGAATQLRCCRCRTLPAARLNSRVSCGYCRPREDFMGV